MRLYIAKCELVFFVGERDAPKQFFVPPEDAVVATDELVYDEDHMTATRTWITRFGLGWRWDYLCSEPDEHELVEEECVVAL